MLMWKEMINFRWGEKGLIFNGRKGLIQSNLVNMNSMGPSKKVHIKRNFTLTVARCMGVIVPGDFKVVRIKSYFALNVFVLTRFHSSQRRERVNPKSCKQRHGMKGSGEGR